MKKPLVAIIKDTHLTKNNGDTVWHIFEQFIRLMQKHGIKKAIHLGDFFSERGSHNLDRLEKVGQIIKLFIDSEIILYTISGNHDKDILSEERSYLDLYQIASKNQYYVLFHNYHYFDLGNVRFHFIPYFLEGEHYNERLGKIKKGKSKNVLFTHIAVNGVRNNDGSIVDNGIPLTDFKSFNKVFIGHYHEENFIPPNIYYLPGSYQQNYGESPKKGFTILYDDLSTSFHQSEFIEYKKLKIAASDKKALQEITTELGKMDLSGYNVRLILTGNQSEIESVDTSLFQKNGVDVKWENTQEVAVSFEDIAEADLVVLEKKDLLKYYTQYAKEFDLTLEQHNQGLKRLKLIK